MVNQLEEVVPCIQRKDLRGLAPIGRMEYMEYIV
jgi:hypothetical protein